MGDVLMTAGGGLNQKDKDTVKQWMVQGHSIQNGKVEGTIPVIPKDEWGYIHLEQPQKNDWGDALFKLPESKTGYADTNLAMCSSNGTFKPENIKAGVNVLGVGGTYSPEYHVYCGIVKTTGSVNTYSDDANIRNLFYFEWISGNHYYNVFMKSTQGKQYDIKLISAGMSISLTENGLQSNAWSRMNLTETKRIAQVYGQDKAGCIIMVKEV